MTGAAAKTLRPVDAGRVERILRRLEALWGSRGLGDIDVVPNARLTRTLGRPVCQSSRVGRRPVNAWRCAACIAAGLDGRLEITCRISQPTKAR